MLQDKNFALILGGGSARGLIHAGVIKFLREKKISPKIIAGTSMGAIIGAFYAAGVSDQEIENILSSVKIRHFLDFDILKGRGGFIRGKKYEKWLYEILGDIKFEDLSIPLKVNATDFNTGEEIVFDKGLVVPAVRASMNFPVIFIPYKYQGHLLVDGGVTNNLPISLVKNCRVNRWLIVNPYYAGDWDKKKNKSKGVWDMAERTVKLYSMSRYKRELKALDNKIYLQYKNPDIAVYNFNKAKKIIQDGYDMAKKNIKTAD